jgi:hypothetical protein
MGGLWQQLESKVVKQLTTCPVRGPKVHVEFLGASGIGKSYLLGRLVEELKNRNIAVANLDDAQSKKTSLRTLHKVLTIAWVTLRIRPLSVPDYLKIVRLLARKSDVPRHSPEVEQVFVRSEGVFHDLRIIARRSQLKDMYEIASRLLPILYFPDVVVVLEASAQRIYDQRISRSRRGDVFSLDSVKLDSEVTNESIRVIESCRVKYRPKIQVVKCNLEQLQTHDAVYLIAGIIEDASIPAPAKVHK